MRAQKGSIYRLVTIRRPLLLTIFMKLVNLFKTFSSFVVISQILLSRRVSSILTHHMLLKTKPPRSSDTQKKDLRLSITKHSSMRLSIYRANSFIVMQMYLWFVITFMRILLNMSLLDVPLILKIPLLPLRN